MRTTFDLGPLPTISQVEEIWDAACYSYEAGQYPPGLSSFAVSFIDGDGGLLNALAYLRRALELLEVERCERQRVESWHGKAKVS